MCRAYARNLSLWNACLPFTEEVVAVVQPRPRFVAQLVAAMANVGLAEDENDTRTAAETLRSQLARHWPVIETVSAANGGFAVLRHADGVEVDMYYHPPQREPGSVTVTGSVQLHVDHLERAAASEAQAVARADDESTK